MVNKTDEAIKIALIKEVLQKANEINNLSKCEIKITCKDKCIEKLYN